MQIKPTVRYHYTPIRMIKTKNTPHAGKNAEKLDHSHIACGNTKWHSDSEKQFAISLKTKPTTTIWPSNYILGIYPKEMKTYVHTKTCTLMFIEALFVIPQN